ncbi:MAG TPA: cysteine hydrolase [Desulfobacteraceae bacterium]|nr:cysteine hydrolase [Desulfobacteraceae bacterium]
MLLLVIDMQKGLFTDSTPRFDTDGVVGRINRLIDTFRQNDLPTIFIQHDGTPEDGLAPGTPGWEILDNLHRSSHDPVIRKQGCDGFLDTSLADAIHQTGHSRIVITGCATDFCVDTTVRSAASKGFEVTVARDAHTTGDRPHLDAETIITHHNWSWENLILPGGKKVQVLSTDTLLKEI